MVPEIVELEDLRKNLGLSQSDVASLIGVGMSTYQGWIYRDIRPSYESLQKINNFIDERKTTENIK